MASYIHGENREWEVDRLEKQATYVAPITLPHFDAAPGMRVLDLATGVGAMAGKLLARFPGIELVGVDLREAQLASARKNHPEATYLQADATALPFADASFDRVHCSWLLEHVPDPVRVLREVRRVLKPGGRCQFVEVDNATFQTTPPLPKVIEAWAALNDAQIAGGGDPFIGPKLPRLFAEAGFLDAEVVPLTMQSSTRDPADFVAFAEEFAEILESVDDALGPARHALVTEAAAEMRALPGRPGATMAYYAWLARAVA